MEKIILQKINPIKKFFLVERDKNKKKFLLENKALGYCKRNSKLIDSLINQIFINLNDSKIKLNINFCICAVGGYGRETVAPYSDLDLLFLFNDQTDNNDMQKIVEFILFPLWDLGFSIGYAVRNIEESISLSSKDHVIQTSMLDARFICGSQKLYNDLMKRFKNQIEKSGLKLLKSKIIERKKRLNQINFDYFKNEPNLKESEGSLRDINLVFWGLNILKLTNKPELNNFSNFLTIKERRLLLSSYEFLLLLRCHLHLQSQRSNDKLSFDYQKAISKKIYQSSIIKEKDSPNIFAEKMIKDYFKHSKNTKNLAEIFSNIIENILNKEIKKYFFSMPEKKPVSILQNFLTKLSKGRDNAKDKRIILEYLNKLDKSEILNSKNLKLFKEIFFSTEKEKFITLFDLGIISKMIPEFSKIYYLPQFDRYHSLSVGQHTLKALSILKDLEQKKIRKSKYNFFYEEIKKKFNKKALYYATLLHDIGKGKGGAHNEKGAKIARKVVLRFGESFKTADDTFWLVYNHSILSDVAFKKDLEDHSVIRNIAKKIKNLQRLRALFLLTITDISAVEQGIWNNWKATLLGNLYLKLERQIKSPDRIVGLNEKIEKIKDNILRHSKKITLSKLDEIAKITYPNYWLLQAEKMIIFQIEHFNLTKDKYFNFIIKKSEDQFFDLILVTQDRPRLFLNLISIFVSENISVYEARIFTLDNGTVIDTFKFSLNDENNFNKTDSKRILNSIKKKITNLGEGKEMQIGKNLESKIKILKRKVDVNFDNESSSTYSILIVKTNNRPKLLYDISNILIKNNLIISMAKISTNGDFVEDSFHLRSEYGLKIENKDSIKNLVNEIIDKLNHNLNDVI